MAGGKDPSALALVPNLLVYLEWILRGRSMCLRGYENRWPRRKMVQQKLPSNLDEVHQ